MRKLQALYAGWHTRAMPQPTPPIQAKVYVYSRRHVPASTPGSARATAPIQAKVYVQSRRFMPASTLGLARATLPIQVNVYTPSYIICRLAHQGQPGLYYIYRPKYTQTLGVICRLAHQGHALAHAAYIGQSIRILQASCASQHRRVSPGHTTYIGQCLHTLLYHMPASILGSARAILPIQVNVYTPSYIICRPVYQGQPQAIPPIYTYIYIPSCIICRLVYQGQPRLHYLYIPIYTNRPPIITMSIYRPSIIYRLVYDNRGLGHTASIYLYIYTLLYYTLAGILSLVQVTPPLDANVFVSQYTPASILYQEISRQCYIYMLVFVSSQYYTLAGILDQEMSRARRLYMLKYIRPPSIMRQPVYYIRRHLGNAVYICQCLYILVLYAGQHTILGEVQGTLPIYANVFVPSQYHTLASILYQETSRARRLYIPMSLYPSIIRQPVYYIRGSLGHATCIYQCLRALLALYASQHTILGDVQGMLPIYANVFISQHYTLAGILYQGKSKVRYLYMPMSSRLPSVICRPVQYIRRRLGNAACICQCLRALLALYAGQYSILGDIQEMLPIYTKVYILLVLYAGWYTILRDVQYMPPIYTNIFTSQHYIPASVLYQGTSSIYRLYMLVFISQHYTNISSRIIYQPLDYIWGYLGYITYKCQTIYILPILTRRYTQLSLGYTTYIYQGIYILQVLYASQYTLFILGYTACNCQSIYVLQALCASQYTLILGYAIYICQCLLRQLAYPI